MTVSGAALAAIGDFVTRRAIVPSQQRRVNMANVKTKKGVIAILTGGGDVPGLNPAIRAITIRAIREGYQVIGLRRGWAGLMEISRDPKADNGAHYQILSEEIVDRLGRTGGTFLHTSRTRPSHVLREEVPVALRDTYRDNVNDLTDEILKNLEFLGVDYLIPIGGDDTLSYGVHLFQRGVNVVGIPKTMDNDVPGTDYCIGFSTCVTRTIMITNSLRTSAGSHERFLVLEVFGRYAGFTAMLPTMAGAANRCVIPEHRFDIEQLTELLVDDRDRNPSKYAIVLVSEGAMFEGGEMVFQSAKKDAYGHMKLGGFGDLVSAKLKELSPKYNRGQMVNTINQRLGYLVRGGDPDAIDSVVPMAYGNLALDLILDGVHGRLVVLKNGRYDNVPIDVVTSAKKKVNVAKHYNIERLRPLYKSFKGSAPGNDTHELETDRGALGLRAPHGSGVGAGGHRWRGTAPLARRCGGLRPHHRSQGPGGALPPRLPRGRLQCPHRLRSRAALLRRLHGRQSGPGRDARPAPGLPGRSHLPDAAHAGVRGAVRSRLGRSVLGGEACPRRSRAAVPPLRSGVIAGLPRKRSLCFSRLSGGVGRSGCSFRSRPRPPPSRSPRGSDGDGC